MSKGEIRMLTDLVEHEIFHAEGVANAFSSKESKSYLKDLQSVLKALQKPSDKLGDNLSEEQKELLVGLIKQAKLEVQRVLDEQEKIKKIQKDSNILNKLEQSFAT